MTDNLQSAKSLVANFQSEIDCARPGEGTAKVCTAHLSNNHQYRGMRPFYDLSGARALADEVWSPLKRAMPTLQRRPDIFFASHHDMDKNNPVWVASMGNYIGDFIEAWLGIPPNGKATYLPFATLNRVEADQIVETVEFLDVLAVITQAGLNPYSGDQSGGNLMSPGPRTHDGLLRHTTDPAVGKETLDLSLAMLTELAESYTSPADHLARFWHRDMNWFGPTGIGASLGFPGYRRGHTGPFEEKLQTVEIHDWELAVAQGHFSAVMWWPCLTMRNIGDYMGAPQNAALADMRVVDLYRRDGNKLAENWIFIDLLHFLAEQGFDLLADIGGKT
ncbi:MAG: nuclear transport factor 2 family protein [Pseudomonadota bacterium]